MSERDKLLRALLAERFPPPGPRFAGTATPAGVSPGCQGPQEPDQRPSGAARSSHRENR